MLTVRIHSFSYRSSGIPEDNSGNGGGFVFDCRFIYNPGRHLELMSLTGKDKQVKQFLDSDHEMQTYLNSCFKIVDSTIGKYIERNFTNLMISFGCTGGRHRSVYAAERLNEHLIGKYDKQIQTELTHSNI